MYSYHSTADEITDSGVETAVLPIGSTEQHGPHLPIATDIIIVSETARAIAERLDAFLLPTLPISTCREHTGRKGSTTLRHDTFYRMVSDIVQSLKEQGFKRVVIVQGHGGIFVLGPLVREINAANTDFKVIRIDFLQFFPQMMEKGFLECSNNLHACEYETSLMLYLEEGLVRKDLIEDCLPTVPRDYLNYGSIFKYSKNGVWGAPSLATREKGILIFQSLIDQSIDYIDEVLKILAEKTY